MNKKTIKLSNDQISGLLRLIDEETTANNLAGDEVYNTYWDNIKMALGYAIVK